MTGDDQAAATAGGYPPELARLTATEGGRFSVLRYGPGPDQFGELWSAAGDGPHPVVALLHGGYWRSRYRLDVMHALAADLQRRGLTAWNIEYRRVGGPGGGWPGTFEDVAAAFDALADHAAAHGLDLGRVAVVGHSAGGQLALWLAGRARLGRGGAGALPGGPPRVSPAVVVALAGVCDLVAANRRRLSDNAVAGLLGGDHERWPERYRVASPTALLPLGVRQILVHGTADTSVPFTLSADHRAAASAAGDDCTLLELPGVDHFALIDPGSMAWRATMRALGDALATAG
jgi:acetyl esterase/lipase